MKQVFLFTNFIFFLFLFTFFSNGQQGALDSSFGIGGKVVTSIKTSSVYGACKQYDDKIIQTGVYFDDDKPEQQGILLIRYNKDGSIDTKFGDSGAVNTYLDTSLFYNIGWGYNVNVQKDGSIFVTATTLPKSDFPQKGIMVIKYKTNGSIDSSFGINGLAVTEFFDAGYHFGYLFINATIIQPDCSILVNGSVEPDDQSNKSYVYVIRYTKEGKPDEGFGEKGVKKIDLSGNENLAQDMTLLSDNKILLAMSAGSNFLFIRLLSNGSFDNDFGSNGIVDPEPGSGNPSFSIHSIAVLPGGKFVSSGIDRTAPYNKNVLAILRYNPDGSIDKTFGSNGKTLTKVGLLNALPSDIEVDADNRILVCGSADKPQAQIASDFLLVRYTPDGIVDSSFAVNGIQLTDFSNIQENNSDDRAQRIIIQNNGSIVVSGDIYNSFPYLGLARYIGDTVKLHPLITKIKRWIRNHILNFRDNNPNADYYVIEESQYSKGFLELARVEAGSNGQLVMSNEQNETYSYALPQTRNEKPETVFYRIKAVNKDNSFTYSSPISSSDDAAVVSSSLKIYPNPVKDKINIQSAKEILIRLQNSFGQVLLAKKIKGNGSMDVSKLPVGIYYIFNVESGEVFKLVKE